MGKDDYEYDEDDRPCSIPFAEAFGSYGAAFITAYVERGGAAGTYIYSQNTGKWSYTGENHGME
jgi:hypothetical protein